jgi:hypothetical protein
MTLLLPRLVIHQDSQTENPRVATLMTVIVYGHDALSGYHFQTISLQVSNGSVNIAHANMFPALSSACHSVAKIRCWRLLLLFSLYSPIFVLLDGGTLVLTPATPPFTNLIAIAVISQIRFQKPPVLPWVLDRLRTLAAIGCSRCDCSPGCVVQIGSRPRWQGFFRRRHSCSSAACAFNMGSVVDLLYIEVNIILTYRYISQQYLDVV